MVREYEERFLEKRFDEEIVGDKRIFVQLIDKRKKKKILIYFLFYF